MAKRSNFEKRAADKYYTPRAAVTPLLPFLSGVRSFAEPCGGDGRLARHLRSHGLRSTLVSDLEPGDMFAVRKADALTVQIPDDTDMICTNLPWTRPIMHALIDRLMREKQCWFLFDADWCHTTQGGEVRRLLRHCSHIVAIGRVKWIEDSKMSGKDNACWHRFDISHTDGPRFYPK